MDGARVIQAWYEILCEVYFTKLKIPSHFQRMYYYEPTGECFELYHQGPCPDGHILSFNYGTFRPQCKCRDGYYQHADGKCYQLNTKG